MLTSFRPCHLRVEGRRPVRGAMSRLLGHSRLAPARVAPFAGVGER
jgi:hypothetical protein